MTSLRSKIILSMLVIICLIITGSYFIIQDIQQGIIEGEFREKGFLLASHAATEFTNPLLENDLMGIKTYMDNLKITYPELEYIYLTDPEGLVLVHTFDKGFPVALKNFSRPINVENESIIETDNGTIHEFDASIFENIGYVHVGLSENIVRKRIFEASRKLLLLDTFVILLGGMFAYFIGRRLTDPVLKLTEGANLINKGILDQKIDIKTDDELGELAGSFNKMAYSLSQKMNDLVTSKEQLESAQNYLETLFDSIDDGILVVNLNNVIVKANRSVLNMMGMSEDDVIGEKCNELIFKDADSKNICPVDSLLKSKKPSRFIHELQLRGNKNILEINASPFLERDEITNVILVLRNVTVQKALEEEIISRNRELTILNDISKNINENFDLDKILEKSLNNLLKLTGMEIGDIYLFDEKSGKYILRKNPGWNLRPDSREVLMAEDVRRILDIGTENNGQNIHIPLRSKDKLLGIIIVTGMKPFQISDRDRELYNAIGNQIGVAIENVMFYQYIKYLNDFNEEIINNINQAIHVVDKDMNIIAANNELVNLSKGILKKDNLLNRNLYDVFPFLKSNFVDKEYEYVINTGEIFQSEEKTEYEGDVIYTNTSKIPIKDKSGHVEKIITVMKDVSEQKRLEEELKDSYDELKLTYSKLKELYKIKDNFLSNMSHELRTPLTNIMGYTELILDDKIPPEQRNKFDAILRNSKRLSNLLDMLLDTTLIESNNLSLYYQLLPVHEIVSNVIEDMKITASIKNIPIYIDIPKTLMIEGDKNRLTQVFSSLLDNAIKFTIKGNIKIAAGEENENIHIIFNDTGIGIPEEKLELIFDRFYQSDISIHKKYGGTGLGLWISRKIIEAHGGKIWAESKNTGSTFHILLPKWSKHE